MQCKIEVHEFDAAMMAQLFPTYWVVADAPRRYHSTVMKLSMMLHFAATAGPYTPEAERTSNAYTKFVKQLLADGLIERPTSMERLTYPGWAYKATDKGKAYVKALTDVQLPVGTTTWAVPA